MKTLQVSMENRVGCTLRGIVTLPETNEPVPFVLNLHGFAGSASGYKYLHTHMARMLADHGVGCARFDFYGCGESDGEFSDMTFDGLHSDAADLYAWVRAQPYVDSRRVFLSGQSMGGYVAASIAPRLRPHGLILMCPGAGMWYGCARRADMVTQSGKDYADLEGLVYKMAFNYNMAAHPDPFEEAKGYNGPVPFPVSWTVKMKKKQKETQDILSYHTQAAGCSDKARAKASGGRQPIEECGRTGL